MLRVLLLRILLGGLGRLPLPAVQRLGGSLGWMLWCTRTRMALVTRENLALCFPGLSEEDRAALARSSLVETGKTIAETAFAWTANLARCNAAIVAVEGRQAVDEALAGGRGLIFVIPHLGNWEIINHYLGREYGLTHMYQPNRSRRLNGLIQQWRARTGTRFVEADRRGIRAQLAALRAGAPVGAMPDQEPAVHTGRFAPFFGIPCLSNTLIPNLARRTGAPAVIAWCQRLDGGAGFRITFEPVDLGLGEAASLAALNAGIERAVRRIPEQYLWSYKRFRTRPAGLPELYGFRQHPVRIALEKAVLGSWLWIGGRLPLAVLRVAGALAGGSLRFTRSRYARTARTNLRLCAGGLGSPDIGKLARQSLRELGKTAAETARVWKAPEQELASIVSVEGDEYLGDGPAIVLTPPLGNREVVMRLLGTRFPMTEYYHPNSNTALDDVIRRRRRAMGVRLLPHTAAGIEILKRRLARGEHVTLCPDQQPRPRWGEFVPFFGVPALTPGALACLIQDSGVPVIIAAALREGAGFRLLFTPCPINARDEPGCILAAVNRQLEQVIRAHPAQYRWSDKRFNIRPFGAAKVYSGARP